MGDIIGPSKGLICAAITKAEEQKEKVKLYSGGESGELFMHVGTPFNGAGTTLERFPGEYINGIVLD